VLEALHLLVRSKLLATMDELGCTPFPAELSQLAGSRQFSWEVRVASRYWF